MKQLYFVRHGQTEWNAIARMQGQWNSNLNELGRAQADVNGQLLSKLNIETIYASPLDRTRQTAAIVNKHLNLPITYDDRIMEWDCGDWSGELYADVAVKWKAEWDQWQADRFNYRGPNCENYPDMFERAAPFLEEVKTSEASRIAIVSHGMISRVMMAHLLGFDAQQTLDIHVANDTVFQLNIDADDVSAFHYIAGKGPHPGMQPPA